MYRTAWKMVPCFYILLLNPVSITVAYMETSLDITTSLTVLDEMFSGPLYDRNLVLYLDPKLDTIFVQQFLALPSLHHTPHAIVDLGTDGFIWSEYQTSALLRSSYFIHIVLFATDPTPFFQTVSQQWNPKYLLLYSFASSLVQVLLDESFQGVERIALMTPLVRSSNSSTPLISMYTSIPFSTKRLLKFIGVWKLKNTSLALDDIFIDRFLSFEGHEFPLATWLEDFPFLAPHKTDPDAIAYGVAVEMLNAIASISNFSYTMTMISTDSLWGDFENGSWNGMLGMIHRKEKEFTVNNFIITGERLHAFDASVSYWMEGFGIFILTPPPLPKWRGIYYPFPPNVWFSIALTFTLIVVIMTIEDRVQQQPFLGSFGETWPYMLRAVVNHSQPRLPEAQWQRVFVGWWWLYCFILTTAYTANLIAFLTIPVPPKRIKTIQELAESDYRLSMMDYGEFVPGALLSSIDPYYHMLGVKMELFDHNYEAVYAMLNRTHAHVDSVNYNRILYVARYKVKNFYMLREQLYPGHLCWYFRKNTAWKYKFDVAIRRLVEAGLIAHWLKIKNDFYLGQDFERRQQLEAEETTNTPLMVEHILGTFFILIFGWIIASLIFIYERLQKYFFLDKI